MIHPSKFVSPVSKCSNQSETVSEMSVSGGGGYGERREAGADLNSQQGTELWFGASALQEDL